MISHPGWTVVAAETRMRERQSVAASIATRSSSSVAFSGLRCSSAMRMPSLEYQGLRRQIALLDPTDIITPVMLYAWQS